MKRKPRLLTLLYLIGAAGLSSCAYYGDLHSHSEPLKPADLKKHNTAKNHAPHTLWWHQFKDTQLNQLIHTALADSPSLQIASARVHEAESIADKAAAARWPTVDASGYVARERFSKFGLVPPPFNGHTYNIGTVGLNFNYEFDFWGKNRQFFLAKLNEAEATRAELTEAELIIAAAVADTYFQLRNHLAQTSLAKNNWQITQQLAEIASARAKHGIESDIPVNTMIANADAAKLTFEQYREATQVTEHQLAVLLGKNPFTTTLAKPATTFNPYQPQLPADLPASLLAKRPDIVAAKARAEAAAKQINVAKAYFFPDINLNLLFSYQSLGLGHLFDPASQNNAITGAIDLPLFDAGARRANLGAKYAEYDHAVNLYNQTILTALQEVADQLSRLQTIRSQLKAEKSALAATERHYKLYQSRYQHGINDYAELQKKKQLLLQQQATQQTLETRYLQAVVGMLKALGGNDR